MNKIKTEIQKLQYILDEIKQCHINFVDFEINKLIHETSGVDINDEVEKVDYLSDNFKVLIASKGNKNLHKFQKNLIHQFEIILDVIINLNKLLDKPIKKIQSIEEIKQKELLSIKEVEQLFGISKTQQQGLRSRLKTPLPHHKQSTKSKSANTKVYYKKNELEEWFKNYY